MKPYPKNDIPYATDFVPVYTKNDTPNKSSRYAIYRVIDNLPSKALGIRLSRQISKNETFNGYYYTTTKNETLYSIAEKYYGKESFYWIIAMVNYLKDDGLSILPKGITLIIPNFSELQKSGGYFTLTDTGEV